MRSASSSKNRRKNQAKKNDRYLPFMGSIAAFYITLFFFTVNSFSTDFFRGVYFTRTRYTCVVYTVCALYLISFAVLCTDGTPRRRPHARVLCLKIKQIINTHVCVRVAEVRQEAVQQALAAMQSRPKPSLPMPSKRTSVMARSPDRSAGTRNDTGEYERGRENNFYTKTGKSSTVLSVEPIIRVGLPHAYVQMCLFCGKLLNKHFQIFLLRSLHTLCFRMHSYRILF